MPDESSSKFRVHRKHVDVEEKVKKCARCRRFVPYSMFGKKATAAGGLSCYCFECSKARQRERRAINGDAMRAYSRARYAVNAEKERAIARMKRAASPEYGRAYAANRYKENPEKYRAKKRARRVANPDLVRAQERIAYGIWPAFAYRDNVIQRRTATFCPTFSAPMTIRRALDQGKPLCLCDSRP